MLTLYCDVSGKEKALVTAGFVSTVDEWRLFDRKWTELLQEFGVERFHMREFAHSVGQFAEWKGCEDRRKSFCSKLIDQICDHTKYWLGACVLLEDYRKVDAEYQLHEQFWPITLSGRACIDLAEDWRQAQHRGSDPIKWVFEHGDEHWGQLSERIYQDTGVRPLPGSKDLTPLQAADLVAWELLKVYRLFEIDVTTLFQGFRKTFQRLTDMPHRHGHYGDHELRILCRVHEIPRR